MNDWARKIRHGDVRALARAATGVENGDAGALAVLRELEPYAGHASTIGITGSAGAGKSTLVDGLARQLREAGKTVAILAVDPSSHVSGGAILGDRIRMQRHHGDRGMFIRSIATRGGAGGLSRATAGLAALMDRAGKDYVLIETVGVGQDEVEIARLARTTVVVLVPGMGDDVQAIKAGIMEIADIFVINKADQPGADRLEHELRTMPVAAEHRRPPIVRTVATEGVGIGELLEAILEPRRGAAGPTAADNAAIANHHAAPAPERAAGRAVLRLDHLAIAVPSLESAVLFYRDLGASVESSATSGCENARAASFSTSGGRIELLEPAGADSPLAEFLARRGSGVHHIALRVADLPAAVARLRASGAHPVGEIQQSPSGDSYIFVDPASGGGVLLKLIQENAI